jgi:hypothetical protein
LPDGSERLDQLSGFRGAGASETNAAPGSGREAAALRGMPMLGAQEGCGEPWLLEVGKLPCHIRLEAGLNREGKEKGGPYGERKPGCCVSHSPYLFDSPDTWAPSRQRRRLSEAVPHDSEEENQAKFERCMRAYATLREKIAAVKPDVSLVAQNG